MDSFKKNVESNLSLGQDGLVGSDFLLDTSQGSFVLSDVTTGLGFLVSTIGLQFRQLGHPRTGRKTTKKFRCKHAKREI